MDLENIMTHHYHARLDLEKFTFCNNPERRGRSLAGETGDSAEKQEANIRLGVKRYDRALSSPLQVVWLGTGSVRLSVCPFTLIEFWTINTPVRHFETQESVEPYYTSIYHI
jgi:hypothetical protein